MTYPFLITGTILLLFLVIFSFFFNRTLSLTNFPLFETLAPDSFSVDCRFPSFSTTHHSFRAGLPQELFWSKRSRLSSLPPDDPGRTVMGNCPLSYSCWSPGGRRQHLPTLLPMVYQWRTGLGCTGYIRIVGGVMLRFHFISIFITFHLYISLFHNLCLDCVLPRHLLMFFIHFIWGCTPHPVIMFNHDDSTLFWLIFRYKYLRSSYCNLTHSWE